MSDIETTEKPDANVRAFGDAMEAALRHMSDDDRVKKAADKFIGEIADDFHWKVVEAMPEQLEGFILEMANKAVEAMLRGDDAQVRRYLGLDGWNGRNGSFHVIGGKLGEYGSLELRKMIAQANREIITDERILDLEAQLGATVKMVSDQCMEIERLRNRIRELDR